MNNKNKKALTPTMYMLMAQFNGQTLIPISELSDLLNLSEATMNRKAAKQGLPFPVARLGEGQRSPYMVKLHDLADYVDKVFKQSERDWKLMRSAA